MHSILAEHPEEFRYLILALQRQGNRQLNAMFSELGLTSSQAEAIEIVGTHGPMSTREVGEYLICESGSPSRLLATLAAKRMTITSQSNQDKRATLHALTRKGRETLQEINTLKTSFQEKLTDVLAQASDKHPDDVLSLLASLLEDPDLTAAIKRRFPHVFEHLTTP